MKRSGMHFVFFGSSLVSAYWNGAATYYRGLIRALAGRGHQVTFYEPDAYHRQAHRDIEDPHWARVVVYPGNDASEAERCVEQAARDADVLIKTSGVGVYDELLERAVVEHKRAGRLVVFWDVDAPATLERMRNHPDDALRGLIPQYDLILSYGGGRPVVKAYKALGARECVPIYNAVDVQTHHPVAREARFKADLMFMGNRLPDREARVEEYFLEPAERAPQQRFLLAGSGWENKPLPANVRHAGHAYTRDHNAMNCSARFVLNISRSSMAVMGHSPATRIFEAAGAGACVISDAWSGLEAFLIPGKHILVARHADDVVRHLVDVSADEAARMGAAAREHVQREHTYQHRALEVEELVSAGVGVNA